MTVFFGNSSGDLMADRRYAMAMDYAAAHEHEAAADLLQQAIELAPQWPPLHFYLGESLRQLQRNEEAGKAFASYLALDQSDIMGASIKLSLMGSPAPQTMPLAYVQSLFDQYAPRFEKALVDTLEYNTPSLLADAINKHHPENFESLLDLGCGTGLAAELFRGRTNHMTGVDLSPGMIAIAQQKKLYDDLQTFDIDAFLKTNARKFDLVLSADVFVYIGDLKSSFTQIAAQMPTKGIFSFSVQELQDSSKEWILTPDHRYSHTKEYITRILQAADFTILQCDHVHLRKDGRDYIRGMVFVACRN